MKTNWQMKKLGEVCNKASSNVSQNQLINDNGKYPIYGAGGFIKNVSFFHQDKEYIAIVKDGAGIGRITLLPECSSVIGTLQYLLPQENIDVKFLYYFLSSVDFLKYRNGSTIPHIYFKDYEIEPILVPLFSEQKRIVKKLDEVFEQIAKAKENAEKNLQSAKELFGSYSQSVFAPPSLPPSHKATAGQRKLRTGKESMGKDWEEKKLKDIGETQTGSTPKTANKKYYGDFIPFIKPADVDIFGNGVVRYNNAGLSESGLKVGRKIKKNSVLMVCIGATIGKVGFVNVPVSCNQQINTLTPLDEYEARIFYYLLSTKTFYNKVIKNSSQATLPIINKGKWENLSVTFPKSIPEQKSIVKKLDELSAETKKLEAIYKQKLADLEELKKSVLKKAFAGEL